MRVPKGAIPIEVCCCAVVAMESEDTDASYLTATVMSIKKSESDESLHVMMSDVGRTSLPRLIYLLESRLS